jgi:hypothetical protein
MKDWKFIQFVESAREFMQSRNRPAYKVEPPAILAALVKSPEVILGDSSDLYP